MTTAKFTLDTNTGWEGGEARIEVVSDAQDGFGIYVEAGVIADGTRGAVATPEQAEALALALLERAAEARRRQADRDARPLEVGDHVTIGSVLVGPVPHRKTDPRRHPAAGTIEEFKADGVRVRFDEPVHGQHTCVASLSELERIH